MVIRVKRKITDIHVKDKSYSNNVKKDDNNMGVSEISF